MKRIFVKAGLAHLSVAKKIVLGNAVVAGLDNNPLIPNATQMKQDVETATQNLTAASAQAKIGTHADEQAMLASEIEFDRVLNRAILFVQEVADAASTTEDAKEIILSSGFGARKSPEKSPVPAKVIKLRTITMPTPGDIDVRWKSTKYARAYILYHSLTPAVNGSWERVAILTERNFLHTGLAFAAHYYKVVAVGVSGDSDPSDVITGVCLPI